MNPTDVRSRPPEEDEENLDWPEDHLDEEEEDEGTAAELDEDEDDPEEKELDWVISQEEADEDW